MYAAVLMMAAVVGQDDGTALAAKRLDETTSRLLATIERLESRIGELERQVAGAKATQAPQVPHGTQLDPDAVPYSGGRWVYHPQTGIPVFAESEYQIRKGGGNSKIIELVRYRGKPVPLPSVTWGADQIPTAAPDPNSQQRPRERPAASIQIPLPGE